MVLIFTLNICNEIQVKRWNKKKTQMQMTDNKQKTVHSFFIRTILRTIKTEIKTKNFLSKFGKQKCNVINK